MCIMCICVDTYIYLHLYILFIYYQSGTSLWGVTCTGKGPRCEGLISHGLVVRGQLVRASLWGAALVYIYILPVRNLVERGYLYWTGSSLWGADQSRPRYEGSTGQGLVVRDRPGIYFYITSQEPRWEGLPVLDRVLVVRGWLVTVSLWGVNWSGPRCEGTSWYLFYKYIHMYTSLSGGDERVS